MHSHLTLPLLEIIFCLLLFVFLIKKSWRWRHGKISSELFSYKALRLLPVVSTDMAVKTDLATDYDNVKLKPDDYRKIVDGAVQAVSLVVGSRDPYIAGHQRRVAELARVIARELGLSRWQTRGVYIAGLLHDVGKVAIPSEILSKPGKIDENEFNIIKSHCRVGQDILQGIDFPWPISVAVLQHHERLDGSGYPGGLFDEDIILEAKILGVADVVEAMSSHRPYRPALGLRSALAEISRGSGLLFDTKVVDACLKLFKKKESDFVRLMAAAEARREYFLEMVV